MPHPFAAALLAAQIALLGAAAWRFAARLVGAAPAPGERIVAALVLALTRIVLVQTALGAFGLLRLWPVALAGAAIDIALILRSGSRSPGVHRGSWTQNGVVGAVAAAAVVGVVGFFVATGFSGRSVDYDTRQYHVPNAAAWLRDGGLWDLPPANAGYFTNGYPSDHTLVGTWLLLPSRSDQLLYLSNAVWAALAIGAVALLVAALGGRPEVGALVGAGVVATPIVLITQASSLQNDLAVVAGIVGSAAFVVVARDRRRPVSTLVLAGAALGLAVGSKYTAWGPAVGVLVLALWAAPVGRRIRQAALVAAPVVALTLLWVVRNLRETGNPVYPLALGPLVGGDSPLNVYETSLLDHLLHARSAPLGVWADLHPHYLAGLFPLFAVGVVAGFARRRGQVVAVALLALFSYVAYLATPFTGGGPDGFVVLVAAQLRYGLPALALGAAVAAAVLPWWAGACAGLAATGHGLWWIVEPGFRDDLLLAGWAWTLLAGAAALAAIAVPGMARGTRRPVPVPGTDDLVSTAVPGTGLDTQRPDPVPGTRGVVVLVGVFAVLAGSFWQAYRVTVPPASAAATGVLAVIGKPHGRVVLVAVDDVRSLMGPCFSAEVVGVGEGGAAGERPPGTAVGLDRRVEDLRPDVLAVGWRANPVVPRRDRTVDGAREEWSPVPGDWKKVVRVDQVDLYVRRTAVLVPRPALADCTARTAPQP